ncbi:MAG: O-antigen ligase family protein [Candidatus Lokiarchaeota archaeon]|nr:O-antigen ligase family protein [Candidatus Lokiarchaeota archaeon]
MKAKIWDYSLALSFLLHAFISLISNYSDYILILKISSAIFLSLFFLIYLKIKEETFSEIFNNVSKKHFFYFIFIIFVLPVLFLFHSENINFGILKFVHTVLTYIPLIPVILYFFNSKHREFLLKILFNIILIISIILSLPPIFIDMFDYSGAYSLSFGKWSHVTHARIIAPCAAILFYLLISMNNRKQKFLFLVLLILFNYSLVVAGLRAAFLGLVIFYFIGIIIHILKNRRREKYWFNFFISLLILITIVLFFYIHKDENRQSSLIKILTENEITDSSFSARSEILNESLELIKENPIFGIGFGGFRGTETEATRYWTKYPHNIFIELYVEFGIFSILYLVLILYSIKRLFEFNKIVLIFFLFNLFLALFSKDYSSNPFLFSLLSISVIKRNCLINDSSHA